MCYILTVSVTKSGRNAFCKRNIPVLRVKPRLINACGSLNCSFIMTYVMLTTFMNGYALIFVINDIL